LGGLKQIIVRARVARGGVHILLHGNAGRTFTFPARTIPCERRPMDMARVMIDGNTARRFKP